MTNPKCDLSASGSEAGQNARIHLSPNGPYESAASVIEANKRYKRRIQETGQPGVRRVQLPPEGALPHLKIGEIKSPGRVTGRRDGNEKLERLQVATVSSRPGDRKQQYSPSHASVPTNAR